MFRFVLTKVKDFKIPFTIISVKIMKKIFVFATLIVLSFCSSGCTGSGAELNTINRVDFEVDGLRKDFRNIIVDASSPDMLIVRADMGGSLIETIELQILKNVTGSAAIPTIIFIQNDVIYYGINGSQMQATVTENGAERKIKGTFAGFFRSISNSTVALNNGSFVIEY